MIVISRPNFHVGKENFGTAFFQKFALFQCHNQINGILSSNSTGINLVSSVSICRDFLEYLDMTKLTAK